MTITTSSDEFIAFIDELVDAAKDEHGVSKLVYADIKKQALRKFQLVLNTNQISGALRRSRKRKNAKAPPRDDNLLRNPKKVPTEKPSNIVAPKTITQGAPVTTLPAQPTPTPDVTKGEKVVKVPASAPPPRTLTEPPLKKEVTLPAKQVPEARKPYGRVVGCCWPFGEPGTREFHFCGAASEPGRPYCENHVRASYVRVRDRREDTA